MARPITWRNVNADVDPNATARTGLAALDAGFDRLQSGVSGLNEITDRRHYRALEDKIDTELSAFRDAHDTRRANYLNAVAEAETHDYIKNIDTTSGEVIKNYKDRKDLVTKLTTANKDKGLSPEQISNMADTIEAEIAGIVGNVANLGSQMMTDAEVKQGYRRIAGQDDRIRDKDIEKGFTDYYASLTKGKASTTVNDQLELELATNIRNTEAKKLQDQLAQDEANLNAKFSDAITAENAWKDVTGSSTKTILELGLGLSAEKDEDTGAFNGKYGNISQQSLDAGENAINGVRQALQTAKVDDRGNLVITDPDDPEDTITLNEINIPESLQKQIRSGDYEISSEIIGEAVKELARQRYFWDGSLGKDDFEANSRELYQQLLTKSIDNLRRQSALKLARKDYEARKVSVNDAILDLDRTLISTKSKIANRQGDRGQVTNPDKYRLPGFTGLK